MHLHGRKGVLFLALSLLAPASARAWNGTGHMAVAMVAWDQLTPVQRQAFVQILHAHPRYQKDLMQHLQPGDDPALHAFLEAATWPDLVKSPVNPLERTEDHKPWHYVDYPYDLDGQHGPMPGETWDGHGNPTDLLQAMQMVTAQLRDPATPAPRKAIDLCWVEHLVGDAHQPLHAVSLYSHVYPVTKNPDGTTGGGDQGGNLIHVHTSQNPDQNLHSVWDGMEGQSYDPGAIRRIADRVEREHPPATMADAANVLDPIAWAKESFDLAKQDVYEDGKVLGVTRAQAQDNPDSVPPLPVGYEKQAHAAADERIALAGYRLADLLRSLPESPATRP